MNKPQMYEGHVFTTLGVLVGGQKEKIIAYEHTSHSSNIKQAQSSMYPRVYFFQLMWRKN